MTFLLSVVLTASLAPGQSDAPLAWKLKKDDTFYVKTHSVLKQTVEAVGNTQNQDQDQTTFHKYKVLTADKDGMVVEQTVQKTDMKSQLPAAGDIADKMKGLKLTYTLNAKNEVTELDGYDKFLDAVGGDSDMTKELMKAVMSEDTLKTGVADVFGFLSGNPTKAGDTWKREHKLGMGPVGDFALNTEYRLAERGEKGDRITWSATAKYQPPKGDGGLPFTISKGELKAEKMEGEYLFDAKAGRLKSSTTSAMMSGKLTLSANGQEIEMDLKQDLTIKVTVSDKNLADD